MKLFEVPEMTSDFSCFVGLISWIRSDINIWLKKKPLFCFLTLLKTLFKFCKPLLRIDVPALNLKC